MEEILWFALTVFVGCAGGFLGKKLRIPAGALVGAIAAVGALNLLTERAVFFSDARVVLQIFSGTMVGARVGKAELKSMRMLLPSVLALVLSLLVLNLTFALLMVRFSDLSPATALFATAPGGASDMSIIAADFGGDAGIVAILQVARLVLIYLMIPPVVRFCDRRQPARGANCAPQNAVSVLEGRKLSDFLLMLLCAATLGLLAHALGISAGGMIGAMIGSGAFCVARNRQRYPAWLKTALQFGSGAYIGARIVREILWNFDHLLIPLAIMAAGIFAFTFATSALIRRLSHLDRSTAMLISTPGGIQEMSLLSEELGADTPKVAVLHTARLVFVILFFPYIMQALLYMMGEL